ncbi:MAG: rhamnogalacturonan acetylesterase [Bacillota bacterium]
MITKGKNIRSKFFVIILSLFLLLVSAPVVPAQLRERTAREHLTVFIAGDSTVQTYDEKWKPKAGWGQMIPQFFSSEITFENHAIRGRSSKSFINEGRLDRILRKIKPNDYFLIQFGHNDAKKNRPNLYTSVPDYKKYIKKYVDGARQRGATPILVTPMGRRDFHTDTGIFNVSFPEYVQGMKEVAEELNVALVDLSSLSVSYYNSIGPDGTLSIFLHSEPGIYKAFPDGIRDNTHFKEYGAIQMARLLSTEIKKLDIPLSSFVVDKEHPVNVPDK